MRTYLRPQTLGGTTCRPPRDVAGAVRYLTQVHPSNRIAAYAFSMGGAALLHAVGTLPQIRGVVVDSTFADFREIAEGQTSFLPSVLRAPMVMMSDFCGRLELGVGLDDMSSVQHIAAVSPHPLLIIHGTADTLVPPTQARENFAAAREPKELWLVKGAGHCQSRAVAKKQYDSRVAAFFRRCLAK